MMNAKELIDPILTCEEVIDDCGTEYIALARVTFLKDFGPFVKGEQVANIDFRLDEGILYEVDENGEPCGKKCNLALVPA